MEKITGTYFPDSEFLKNLIRHIQEKTDASQEPLEKLLMYCSAAMNWIADYITDPNVQWTKEILPLDTLWLTGTNPQWNEIVIMRCGRSPKRLRELLRTDPVLLNLFSEAFLKIFPYS